MISNNVMLDPSLFVDRQVGPPIERQGAIDKLGRKTSELSFIDFHISETFETVVLNDEREAEWNSIREFFGSSGEFPDRDILQHKLQNYVDYNTFSLRTRPGDAEDRLQGDIDELNEGRYSDERAKILAGLDLDADEDETVAQILVEELAFSLEMSPILSRLKKSLKKMSAAAQSVTTLSEEYASSTSTHIIDWLERESPGYRQDLDPLEALEVAVKYKKMDMDMTAQKLALYREALKEEIPLTNWLGATSGFYLKYVYDEYGALTGDLISDTPALLTAGFTLILLDP